MQRVVMTILLTALAWPADSMRLYRTDPSDYLVDTAVLKQQLEVARSRLTRKTLQDSIDDGTIPVDQEGEEDGDENGLGLLEPLDEVPIKLTDADKAAMAAFNAYDGDEDEFPQEDSDGFADGSEQEASTYTEGDTVEAESSSEDLGQLVGTETGVA
ncbi:hypothetical protein N2152v2_010994 [Parachlorella kessleri]